MTIVQRIRPMTAKTWLRTTAPKPTPSAAQAAVSTGVPSTSQRTSLVDERERDVADGEDRVADPEREPDRGEAEEDAHQQAREHLRGDHAASLRRDDEGRADRAVAELARDRHHADQGGEQCG